jgi:hypothetical protein
MIEIYIFPTIPRLPRNFSITPCETVVLWLSFRAVENRDVFARAYMDVFTASLKDNHNTTLMVKCTAFLRSYTASW